MANVGDNALPTRPQAHQADHLNLPYPEICVVCLDLVSEKAIAEPCKHDSFDLGCLGTWLQNQNVCPLCKSPVRAIWYHDSKTDAAQLIQLPTDEVPKAPNHHIRHRRAQRLRSRNSHLPTITHELDQQREKALEVRRNVYRHRLCSRYVGANRLNGYRVVVPRSFANDENLVSRARRWIRRELAVFDFLNPNSTTFGQTDRRASNAEFLLEYMIAILKAIDIKGSAGQAQELLADFLGRENAQLFLHELESWLRSPYESLDVWDANVQY